MAKDEIDILDTNLALYGGKEHKDWAFEKASLEKEYKGAGEQGPGVQVWRVKNEKRSENSGPRFGIIKVHDAQVGEFYSGDAYVILETYLNENKKKCFNLFFWLGRNSAQDEIGVAAYKTVELDDLLGDAPVQHREIQGNESIKFLKLFKRFRILEGGFESGFTQVKPVDYKPRLLKLHGSGKESIKIQEVKCVRASLNETDAFVLDLGLEILVFHGKNASAWEKSRAVTVANELAAGPGRGKSKCITIDSDCKSQAFWKAIGGKGAIAQGKPEDSLDVKGLKTYSKSQLWRLSDHTGKLLLRKQSDTPERSDVKSEDVFLLDLGSEVVVFVGKKVSAKERYGAISVGMKYLKSNNMSISTPISKVVESTAGAEEMFSKMEAAKKLCAQKAGSGDAAKSFQDSPNSACCAII